MFEITNSIKLLNNVFYIKKLETQDFTYLISKFKEAAYNLIIPNSSNIPIEIDHNVISNWIKKGYKFSYYIPAEFKNGFKYLLKSDTYTDLYLYKEISKPYKIPTKNIVNLNQENINLFLNATNICFPNWKNNEEFMLWCLNTKEVGLLGILENNDLVSFGAFILKDNCDYALLMNGGTLPKYRRQGLHTYLIKARINEILKTKKKFTVYVNVEKDKESHMSFKKLEFICGKLFYVSEV